MTIPYNPASSKADEFINHEEIMETLAYADERVKTRNSACPLLKKPAT